jgi:hypothetical protein
MTMPKAPTRPTGSELPKEAEVQERAVPGGHVRTSVIAALGRPPGLYEVSVKPLWGNHFRVNVLIGPDPTSVHIAHSYFIEATEAGDILKTTPLLTRLYA